jgi:hypothetical protein
MPSEMTINTLVKYMEDFRSATRQPASAVSARANVKAVQRMLCHAKAPMTLDTHADLFAEDLDEVADRLHAAIRATADGVGSPSRSNASDAKILPAR